MLTIALPVVIQMPLESLEDLQRHGVRLSEIALEHQRRNWLKQIRRMATVADA